MSQPDAMPRRGAVAVALIVIGLMILVPSGLCTSAFAIGGLVTLFTEPNGVQDFWQFLTEALFVGGPFVAIGTVLLVVGLRCPRARPPSR
ncbi:MAG TPA: hypothetical protein VGI20_00805 [Rhizomicrobium sp.]|jgi:hypothetical protein